MQKKDQASAMPLCNSPPISACMDVEVRYISHSERIDKIILMAKMPDKNQGDVKQTQQRVTQACDLCHKRNKGCKREDGASHCQNCQDSGKECTYNRIPKKRGPKGMPSRSDNAGAEGESGKPFYAPTVAKHATIVDLVEIYFEIVYPIFPFFHQLRFTRSISRAEYQHDQPLFATTMAMCALVSGRVHDGCVTNPKWHLDSLKKPTADVFYLEAEDQLERIRSQRKKLRSAVSLNEMRARALLAIAAIQKGAEQNMTDHLAEYHTLVSIGKLNNESNWPTGMGNIEMEERRRLFWSMYTLDVFSSIVWGNQIRSRDSQSNVKYPTEIDDEFIQDSPPTEKFNMRDANCWLRGWNFITTLYRAMDHVLSQIRGPSNSTPHSEYYLEGVFEKSSRIVLGINVQQSAFQDYRRLLPKFQDTQTPLTYVPKKDIYGFQAANIIASLQLLNIIATTTCGASIDKRCAIVRDVLNAFHSIHAPYLRAIGAPLLHHLGGISAILSSVLEEPLKEIDYRQVRDVISSMVELLKKYEATHRVAAATVRLQTLIEHLDDHMASQRQSAMEYQMCTKTPDATSAMTLDNVVVHNGSENYFCPQMTAEQVGISGLQLPAYLLNSGFLPSTWA